MDLTTFNDHLDRLGAALETWPHALRLEAEALLRTSAEAEEALADARALANLLAALPDVPAPPDLAGQISSTVEDPWQRILAWFSAALWRPVLATGLPLALGFVIGLVQVPAPEEDAYLAADVGLMAFSVSYSEFTDGESSHEN
jgi:hypothetical protein